MPGERQEDVIERQAAQAEVVDPDARLVEPAHALDGGARAAALYTLIVSWSAAGSSSDISASAAIACSACPGSARWALEPLAADAVLQRVGRALGDHPAVVDHRDLVSEPVGLVEVLGRS